MERIPYDIIINNIEPFTRRIKHDRFLFDIQHFTLSLNYIYEYFSYFKEKSHLILIDRTPIQFLCENLIVFLTNDRIMNIISRIDIVNSRFIMPMKENDMVHWINNFYYDDKTCKRIIRFFWGLMSIYERCLFILFILTDINNEDFFYM